MSNLPKPIYNHCLLKVSVDNSQIKFKDGTTLLLDTSFTPNQHASVICEVAEVPDRLVFGKDVRGTMRWRTQMELRKGDTVIVSFLAIAQAFRQGEKMTVEHEGETYFFCHYENCLVGLRKWNERDTNLFFGVNNPKTVSYEELAKNNIVLRDEDIYTVIPLNGQIICEPKEKEFKTSLILPESVNLKMRDKKTVICRFVGSPNTDYLHEVYCDSTEIKSGDVLIVDKETDTPLENESHRTLLGDRELWRIPNHLVHGILTEALV